MKQQTKQSPSFGSHYAKLESLCRHEALNLLQKRPQVESLITVAKLFDVMKTHYFWKSSDE